MKITKQKRFISFLVVFMLVSMQMSQVFATSKTLMNSITPQPSQFDNWCWASVAAASGQYWFSINEYVTCDRDQYDAYEHIYGTPYYDYTGNIMDEANAMNYVAHDYGDAGYITSALDWSYVRTYINQNKPVPAGCYSYQYGLAHMLLVVGYNDTGSKVYYCDPYDGQQYYINYSTFVSQNDTYTWVNSALWGNTWNG